MKRTILTTFAMAALIAATAACAKKNDTTMTDTAAVSQTTTTTQTAPQQTDTSHQPVATSQPTTAQPETAPPPPPEPEQKPMKTIKHKDTTITPTGLKYIDKKIGKGPMPQKGQTIVVNYTGMLLNGKTFDSNVDPLFGHIEPFKTKIGVGQVIPGWDEGMISMKVGGKRRLIIPPDLGYGDRAVGDRIPPHSTLVFDVELLNIEK